MHISAHEHPQGAKSQQLAASRSSRDPDTTTNIVIDLDTFERECAKAAGARVPDVDPFDTTRVCRSANGIQLNASQAVAHALTGHVRRVVIDAAGTVIDLSRRVRLFSGSARDAAIIQSTRCIWPGCWLRASACEADHLHPYGEGGRTNPGDGAPLCGRHNRWKQKGYRTRRDPDGTWHTTRPDGTDIE